MARGFKGLPIPIRIGVVLVLLFDLVLFATTAKRLWDKQAARQTVISQGSDTVPSSPPLFAVLEDLGAGATEKDYTNAALLLDDQLARPNLRGVRYLEAADKLPQAIVAKLEEIEEATPIRSYVTFTGGEAKTFMTEALKTEWHKEGTLNMTREIWTWQKLEDKLVGIHINSVIFTPDFKRARADYLRVTRITNGDAAVLKKSHRAIGGLRTEAHVYWLEQGSDGIWRIRYLSDPVF